MRLSQSLAHLNLGGNRIGAAAAFLVVTLLANAHHLPICAAFAIAGDARGWDSKQAFVKFNT